MKDLAKQMQHQKLFTIREGKELTAGTGHRWRKIVWAQQPLLVAEQGRGILLVEDMVAAGEHVDMVAFKIA
jgi:hypoxanthine-guanine phosphoribosyltransferase